MIIDSMKQFSFYMFCVSFGRKPRHVLKNFSVETNNRVWLPGIQKEIETFFRVFKSIWFPCFSEQLLKMLWMKSRKYPICDKSQDKSGRIVSMKAMISQLTRIIQYPSICRKKFSGTKVIPQICHPAFCRMKHPVFDRFWVGIAK